MKFRKDIIKVGTYPDPDTGKPLYITESFLREIVANTKKRGHIPYVPFGHSSDPRDNTGFIEGFEIADGVLYGDFDIDDSISNQYIIPGRIKRVSFSAKGINPIGDDGVVSGGYLNHVALTVNPNAPDQDSFIKMSTDGGENEICFSNDNLLLWGGDKMKGEEELNSFEKLALYFESKTKLEMENKALTEKVLEFETQIKTLSDKVEAVTKEKLEFETKLKEVTDKLEMEAKAVETAKRDLIFEQAEGKWTPAEKETGVFDKLGNDDLEKLFGARGVQFDIEGKKGADNPYKDNPLESPENVNKVAIMRDAGYSEDEIKTAFGVGGDK
jgi:hypothetical protein